MREGQRHYAPDAPIGVGGVGGSGTRLIAQLLMALGINMGQDLNRSDDDLWFTLIFKRGALLTSTDAEFDALIELYLRGAIRAQRWWTLPELRQILEFARYHGPVLPILLKRRHALLGRVRRPHRDSRGWGFKEPSSHIVLDQLQRALPGLRYIHVVRHGLDMAFSNNRGQLRLWGSSVLGRQPQMTPRDALKYWHRVHRRVIDLGTAMDDRFLLLNYDQMCLEPGPSLRNLVDFLDIDVPGSRLEELEKLIRPPASIGRWVEHGLDVFDSEDVRFVSQLGFDVLGLPQAEAQESHAS